MGNRGKDHPVGLGDLCFGHINHAPLFIFQLDYLILFGLTKLAEGGEKRVVCFGDLFAVQGIVRTGDNLVVRENCRGTAFHGTKGGNLFLQILHKNVCAEDALRLIGEGQTSGEGDAGASTQAILVDLSRDKRFIAFALRRLIPAFGRSVKVIRQDGAVRKDGAAFFKTEIDAGIFNRLPFQRIGNVFLHLIMGGEVHDLHRIRIGVITGFQHLKRGGDALRIRICLRLQIHHGGRGDGLRRLMIQKQDDRCHSPCHERQEDQ